MIAERITRQTKKQMFALANAVEEDMKRQRERLGISPVKLRIGNVTEIRFKRK